MKLMFIILCVSFYMPFAALSQIKHEKSHGIFYKISLATSLTINEDYVAFDKEDSSTFLEPSALFVNNTVGYKLDPRTMVGLNFEYNWHSKQGLHFFPTYLNLQHNVLLDDSSLFVRGGYGTLLNMGKSFEKGNMYKLGLGMEWVDINNAILLGLDFTRKRFGYKAQEGLSTVSIFLEFMVF